jgi:hypothetical protein
VVISSRNLVAGWGYTTPVENNARLIGAINIGR